ncbi:MAG TPA: iron-containing alcohol dehydrogenase [Jatrophihabitans sp.]|nr:iron-containing alcohol dehydrogenase [Jatrophihabitans sp.]
MSPVGTERLAAGLRAVPGHPAAWFGRGAAGRLEQLFDAWDTRRCLVVRGDASYRGCTELVERAGRWRQLRFVQARPQVGIEEIADALTVRADFAPDTILAVGGGSVLDLAKAVANLDPAPADRLAEAIAGNRLAARTARLVLLPTTAGTGAELTRFAAVWDGPVKLSLDGPGLRADVALIDPELTASAPRPVAVAAAADALCQAVESSWAVAGTEQSRQWADQAYQVLLPAVAAGCARGSLTDPALREALAWGAALAGAAIDTSRTTAAHALSYPLTGRLGIPHGAAVALQLPGLIEHNRPAGPSDWLTDLVDRLQDQCWQQAGTELAGLLERLLILGGFPTSPVELTRAGGWQQDCLALLDSPRMRNNPRRLTRADLHRLLTGRRSR